MKTSKLTGAFSYSIEGRKGSFIGILNYFPMTGPQFQLLQHFFFNFSNLQYLLILIYFEMTVLNKSSKTGLSSYIHKIAQIFTLSEALQDNFTNGVYSFFLICTWLYLLLFLLIIALMGIKAIKQIILVPIPRSFLDILFQSHLAVFFWIINMILVTPLSTKAQDKITSIGLGSQDFILLFINAIAFGVNLIIGITLAAFCSEPLKGHRLYATHTSSSQIALFISKTILIPFAFFLEEDHETYGIVIGILGLIFSGFQLFLLIKVMPYFSGNAAKCAIGWNFSCIWISVVHILVIAMFKNETIDNKNGVVYIKMLLLPFSVRLGIAVFNRLTKMYISSK